MNQQQNLLIDGERRKLFFLEIIQKGTDDVLYCAPLLRLILQYCVQYHFTLFLHTCYSMRYGFNKQESIIVDKNNARNCTILSSFSQVNHLLVQHVKVYISFNCFNTCTNYLVQEFFYHTNEINKYHNDFFGDIIFDNNRENDDTINIHFQFNQPIFY